MENPPGEKIRQMVEQWAAVKLETNDEIEGLQEKMWVTVEDFQQKLEDDLKGYQIEKEMIIKNYKRKIEMLKS